MTCYVHDITSKRLGLEWCDGRVCVFDETCDVAGIRSIVVGWGGVTDWCRVFIRNLTLSIVLRNSWVGVGFEIGLRCWEDLLPCRYYVKNLGSEWGDGFAYVRDGLSDVPK